MRITLTRALLLTAQAALLSLPSLAGAQEDTNPKKPLHSPAAAKGFIGGESHDDYVIQAAKGQTMSVHISWRREAGNQAEFTVSESPNFYDGAPVVFGKASNKGAHWSGIVPTTGNYYIYVVAHPAAHYKLRVAVK
jgi:hypothetical protein